MTSNDELTQVKQRLDKATKELVEYLRMIDRIDEAYCRAKLYAAFDCPELTIKYNKDSFN